MRCVLLLVFILSILELARAWTRCDSGVWDRVAPKDRFVHASYARTRMNRTDERKAELEWESYACPAQAVQYSCYFHEGNDNVTDDGRSRAFQIENRRFKPSNAKCLDFRPFDFLSLVRNRRVLFWGDSVVNQVFHMLLCNLNSAAEGRESLEWFDTQKQNRRLCPFGAKHCHPVHGFVGYPSANASLLSSVQFNFKVGLLEAFLAYHKPTKDDVLIMNFGSHYDERMVLEADLTALVQEVNKLKQGRTVQLPHLLFMQTLPQHFPTPNGYWDKATSPQSTVCRPDIQGDTNAITSRMAELDWRNLVADKVMLEYNANVRKECLNSTDCHEIDIVYTAKPLYSQFDTHVGLTPFHFFGHADCTHFCQPSAVFDVVHMAIYNALVDKLGMRQQLKSKAEIVLGEKSELLIKGSGKQVFLLKPDGRYGFTGLQSFVSRGYDFSDVVAYPDSVVDGIPLVGSL